MGYLLFYFQRYGIFTILLPGIWDIYYFISRDLGYLLFYFQGYGIFTILLPGIWDIYYFTSRDLGYLLFYFQGYGILCLFYFQGYGILCLFYFQGYGIFTILLPGIWDILSIFSNTANNKRKRTQKQKVALDPHYTYLLHLTFFFLYMTHLH